MSVQDIMWVEQARPDSLDEIVGNEQVVDRMKDFRDDEDMPNILLEGPQGTGKTAIVTAFAKEKYGNNWSSNVLELNASDERGIDVVRDRIKSFARQGTVGDHGFKIIFLDEADSLTRQAQAALRRTMEDYSDTTRFFLSCNYANKIIGPIQSRCSKFHVGRLDDQDIKKLLQRVAAEQGVEYKEDSLDMLVESSGGDARKAINSLQAASLNGELTEDGVQSVMSVVDYHEVQDILNMAIAGDLNSAMEQLDTQILKEGISEQAFLDKALSVVRNMDIPEDARTKCVSKIADADWRIINGANPHIQLHSLLADMHVARHLSHPNYDDDA